jgi:high-affinity K+ transport system ATPase subunit B
MSARLLAWAIWVGLARKVARLIVDDLRKYPNERSLTIVGSALTIVFVLAAAVTIVLVTL